jgi:hypothetical protein
MVVIRAYSWLIAILLSRLEVEVFVETGIVQRSRGQNWGEEVGEKVCLVWMKLGVNWLGGARIMVGGGQVLREVECMVLLYSEEGLTHPHSEPDLAHYPVL